MTSLELDDDDGDDDDNLCKLVNALSGSRYRVGVFCCVCMTRVLTFLFYL